MMEVFRPIKPKRVYKRTKENKSETTSKHTDIALIEESNHEENIENENSLTQELVQLFKRKNLNKSTEEYSHETKVKLFKLYYKNAVTYEVLQSALGLPSISILPSFIPSTPAGVNDIYITNLIPKVNCLSVIQKYSMLCISLTRIKPHIDYNSSSDTMLGVCGRSNVGPVQYAVIAMVRGITSNWHGIASITLLASLDIYSEFNFWLDKLISTLTVLGIYIKAVMTSTDNFFINAFELRDVSTTNPFFITNKKKVYHLFDPHHLMLLLYNTLKHKSVLYSETANSQFRTNIRTASWNHISQFFELDSTRNFRLTNRSCAIDPDDLQRNKLKAAAQILSMNTATGISMFIDLKFLYKQAIDTQKFLVKINEIFTALYPDAIQSGHERNHVLTEDFWQKSIQFIQSIKTCQGEPGDEELLVKCFCTSMQTVLLLKKENYSREFAATTQYLNQDPLTNFIHDINLKEFRFYYPDLNDFFEVIKTDLMQNNAVTMARDKNNCKTDDFVKNVITIMEQNKKDETTEVKKLETDYVHIDSYCDPESLINVATYLLNKMNQKFKNSVSSRIKVMNSSVYYENKKFTGSLIIPDNVFLQCIYDMDAVFMNSCKGAMTTGSVYKEVVKEMNKYTPLSSTDIETLKYAISLFVELRIFYTIKYNNYIYDTSDKEHHEIIVRRLNSDGLDLDDPKTAIPKFVM